MAKSKGKKPKKGKKSKRSSSSPKKGSPKKRKRKAKPHRPAFEGRRREPHFEPPPGFDISFGSTTPDEAFATIKARLDDAKSLLPEGYDGRVLMHTYADGSIDGELYVLIPEGTEVVQADVDMYEAFEEVAVGVRYWISFGARYAVKTDDERYRRHKGMTQVQTNYQRAIRTNIAEEQVLMQKVLLPGMERKFREEAHSVFIRLHWNPQDIQPKR